jgi:hypothetical protein
MGAVSGNEELEAIARPTSTKCRRVWCESRRRSQLRASLLNGAERHRALGAGVGCSSTETSEKSTVAFASG